MAQFTVEIEGKSHTVDIQDAIPASEVQSKYVAKDFMESEVTRRAKSMAQGMVPTLDDLLKDDNHRTKALDILGVKPGKGDPKDPPVDLSEKFQEWEGKHLNPLKDQNKDLSTRVEALLGKVMERDIIQAAVEAGVRPEFLKPVREGASPLIVKMMSDLFGYDEDSGSFLVRGKDGSWEYASRPSSDRPFKTIGEFFQEWSEDKANAGFLQDQRQRGPGHKEGGRGVVDLAAFKAMGGVQRAELRRTNPDQYTQFQTELQRENEAKLYNKR